MSDLMKNPLRQATGLTVTPAEEEEQLWELVTGNETSLLDLQRRKANIEQRRQDLDLEAKEGNLEAVDWLNQRIYGMIAEVTNPERMEEVMSNVSTGKDLNEAVKATQGIVQLRNDLLDKTYDSGLSTGKKRKIEVAFSQQGTATMVGVKIDDG